MVLGKTLILPEGTRILFPDGYRKNGERDNRVKDTNDITAPVSCDYVTFDTLEAFLVEYCNKLYHKARIYHNGSEYVVSGDLSNDDSPKNIKEAAMMLVQDYDLDPTIAKVMLKEACNGATYDHPKSSVYYITKKAEEVPSTWQDATIPMDQIRNKPPQIRQETMPTVIEDPAQLQQAILAAAQAGIKEVFDITALKLLVRQAHFFDEIQEDLPMFMQVLDSLCRKLFQFYWHTDKMADKYGVVKLKALEESLKCAIDSLSELTIFFKLRTVDGSRTTGDSAGELMSGNMM